MGQQGQYQQRWAAGRPGCLILLLDQSAGMAGTMGAGLIGAGSRKADAAAMVLNNVIKEIRERCRHGGIVRPAVDIAVLGYGGSTSDAHNALGGTLAQSDIVSIADLAANPIKINHTMTQEFDPETGTMVQIPVDVPIWIEPVADDGTPMCAALDAAYAIAYNWVVAHPNNFPPIVVNITDGESGDGDPRGSGSRFSQLATSDGAALLFNCHLSNTPGYQVKYPSDASQVPPEPAAATLFEMSSVLPDPMRDFANASYGMNLAPGARGFVFGGDIMDLTQFITIASLPKADR